MPKYILVDSEALRRISITEEMVEASDPSDAISSLPATAALPSKVAAIKAGSIELVRVVDDAGDADMPVVVRARPE